MPSLMRYLAMFVAGSALISGCTRNTASTSASATGAAALATAVPLSTVSPSASGASPVPVALANSPNPAESTVAVPLATASGASADPSDAANPAASSSAAAVASAPAPLPSVAFDDIASTQHAAGIVALGQLGVLDTTTGHFMPDAPVKRRDFVRWLFKTNNALYADTVKDLLHESSASADSDFKDLTSSDPDFRFVQGMSDAGISVGFPDKTFKGDQPITREQAISIKTSLDHGGVYNGYSKDPSYARYNMPDWKDKSSVSSTYAGAIAQDWVYDEKDGHAQNIGRVYGTIAVLRPQRLVTRGEAADMFAVIGDHTDHTNQDVRTAALTLHPSPSPSP